MKMKKNAEEVVYNREDDENAGFFGLDDEFGSHTQMGESGGFLNTINFNDQDNLDRILRGGEDDDFLNLPHVEDKEELFIKNNKPHVKDKKIANIEREMKEIDDSIGDIDTGKKVNNNRPVRTNNNVNSTKKKNDDILMYVGFGLIAVGVILLITLFFIK